jgi:hypothetical protein
MKWETKSAKFKYCGKPVTRRTATSQTPLGEFKVYESVGGKVFIIHPFIKRVPVPFAYECGIGGFDPDPFGEITGPLRISAITFDEGIARCEAKWKQIKDTINQI